MSHPQAPPPADHDPDDAGEPRGELAGQSWLKLASLGMELAGSTLGLAAIGYLVDWYRAGPDRYGTAIGAFVGFALGMFRFIQKAMRETRHQSR